MLAENPKEMGPPGINRGRYDDDTRIDLKETVCRGVNWIKAPHEKAKWRVSREPRVS
jgi:hypothetical protein